MSYMEYVQGGLPLPEGEFQDAEPIGGYLAPEEAPLPWMQGPPVMRDDGTFEYPRPSGPASRMHGPPRMDAQGRWVQPGSQPMGNGWTGYFDGDEYTELRGLTTEDRTRLQQQLYALGLTRGVPRWGEIGDGATLSGMRELMAMSNVAGEPWQITVRRLATKQERGDFDEPDDPFRFVEAEYLPPDPAEVRNSIRDLAQQIVPDVEISDEEIEYLRDQFEGMGAQQFRAAEQQRMNDARAEFAAGDPNATGDEVIVQSEGVQQVSAADRFREFFEERYSANIQRAEDVEQESNRREMTQGNLGRLLQIATGA